MNTADQIDTGEKPYERNWSDRNPFMGRAIPAQSGGATMTEGAYQRLIGDLLQDEESPEFDRWQSAHYHMVGQVLCGMLANPGTDMAAIDYAEIALRANAIATHALQDFE